MKLNDGSQKNTGKLFQELLAIMKKIKYHEFKRELESYGKTYFTIQDLKKNYRNKKSSLKNLLSRWAKEKIILPLSNGCYCFDIEKLDYLNFACNLVKPSYISLEYALNYHGIIDQIPQVVTLISTGRHKFVYSGPYTFEFTKIKKELFFGFSKTGSYYIASPEKALLDIIYLTVRNKRLVDFSSFNYKKINKKKLFDLAKKFPKYVKKKHTLLQIQKKVEC